MTTSYREPAPARNTFGHAPPSENGVAEGRHDALLVVAASGEVCHLEQRGDAVAVEARALFVPERANMFARKTLSLPQCIRTGQTPRVWFGDSTLRPCWRPGSQVLSVSLGGCCLSWWLLPCEAPPRPHLPRPSAVSLPTFALLTCAALFSLTATQRRALPQLPAPY